MRKGRLTKTKNPSKNSIDWERYSSSQKGWISVKAYLNAHDMKTYVGLVEGSNYIYAIKKGFTSVEEAFKWAESKVDYQMEKVKKGGSKYKTVRTPFPKSKV